jgi:hypothetical protein
MVEVTEKLPEIVIKGVLIYTARNVWRGHNMLISNAFVDFRRVLRLLIPLSFGFY